MDMKINSSNNTPINIKRSSDTKLSTFSKQTNKQRDNPNFVYYEERDH